MATLEGLIRNPVGRPFRRAYIKRRDSSGVYETTWQNISDYVTAWGTFTIAVDDLRLNRFSHSGITISVRNDGGKFSHENTIKSLWHGYFPRYRTLLKIEAGLKDENDNEFPTDTTQGIFVMSGETIEDVSMNRVTFNCKSIISPFEETRADEISGITTASLTASEIMEKIRDATDGAGNALFGSFITSTAWEIQSTTAVYNYLNTTSVLEQYSVWELMNKMAEAENYVLYTTRTGGLVFKDRNANTATSQMSFYGGVFPKPNIIGISNLHEATDKLYTHVRLKFAEDDTATSYVTAGTDVQLISTNEPWKYGRRTYEFENTWLTTETANAVATKLVNSFGNLREEVDMQAKFTPHLNILDRVDVSYRESSLNGARLWEAENWASDAASAANDGLSWDDETATTIEWWNREFKILSKRTNLDTFRTDLTLRDSQGEP